MNFLALDPAQAACAPVNCLEAALAADPSPPACIAWHPAGHLLAAGLQDGSVAVWDYPIRSVCCVLKVPEGPPPVSAVAWGACGTAVLALAGRPGRTLWRWDVLTGALQRFPLREPGTKVCAHPRLSGQCLVATRDGALLVNVDGSAPAQRPIHPPLRGVQGLPSVALYDSDGQAVIFGTERGHVIVVSSGDAPGANSHATPATAEIDAPAIRAMAISAKRRRLLVQTDHAVRVFDVLPGRLDFVAACAVPQDRAVRVTATCFAGQYAGSEEDSHLVYAATSSNAVLAFDVTSGRLLSTLDHVHASAAALHSHPFRPVLVAHYPSLHTLLVWTRMEENQWGRYWPPFRDIRATVEYMEQEKEDDLDLKDNEEVGEECADEEAHIDITTIDEHLVPFFRQLCHPGFQAGDVETDAPVILAGPLGHAEAANDRRKAQAAQAKPGHPGTSRGRPPKGKPGRATKERPPKRKYTESDESPSFSEATDDNDSDFMAPVRIPKGRPSQRPSESDGDYEEETSEASEEEDEGTAVDLDRLADFI